MKFISTMIGVTLAALLVAGCQEKGEQSVRTTNPNFQVELLFTHDGCKVYRFEDYRTQYFVKCESGAQSMQRHESCGKGCTRPVIIQTEFVK